MAERDFPLRPSVTCRVRSLGADPRVAQRLAQMGILPGVEVTIVRAGLLGGPLELSLGTSGQPIALGVEEARALECQVVALPLAAVEAGTGAYRVCELRGGETFRLKMMERGLNVGAEFTVERTRPYQLRLGMKGEVVTVGRGEAQKLIVEPLDATVP